MLFAAIALAAGSGVGLYYKSTLKLRSPVKPLLISLLIAVIAGVTYFVLAGSSPGMSAAIGVVVADALAFAAIGVIFAVVRSEEHTSELQSLMRISYAVFCLKKKKKQYFCQKKYNIRHEISTLVPYTNSHSHHLCILHHIH